MIETNVAEIWCALYHLHVLSSAFSLLMKGISTNWLSDQGHNEKRSAVSTDVRRQVISRCVQCPR